MTAPLPSNGPSCSAPERPPQPPDGAERSAPSPRPGCGTCPTWRSGSDARSGPNDPRQVPVPALLPGVVEHVPHAPAHQVGGLQVEPVVVEGDQIQVRVGGIEPLPQPPAHPGGTAGPTPGPRGG